MEYTPATHHGDQVLSNSNKGDPRSLALYCLKNGTLVCEQIIHSYASKTFDLEE